MGSNPATRTTPGALKSKDFKAPLLFSAFVFPYCFPFRLSRHRSDVGIHPVCAGLLHLSRHMAIDIQGEGCGVVPQVALYGLDIVPSSQGSHRIAVPLRYNYDKPEKPRISRVFGYQARFFILFQPEKSSREVVIS